MTFNNIHFLQLVIGNMLQTRRQRVVFVTKDNSYDVSLTREQMLNGMEIEDLIVSNVVINHSDFYPVASIKTKSEMNSYQGINHQSI